MACVLPPVVACFNAYFPLMLQVLHPTMIKHQLRLAAREYLSTTVSVNTDDQVLKVSFICHTYTYMYTSSSQGNTDHINTSLYNYTCVYYTIIYSGTSVWCVYMGNMMTLCVCNFIWNVIINCMYIYTVYCIVSMTTMVWIISIRTCVYIYNIHVYVVQ